MKKQLFLFSIIFSVTFGVLGQQNSAAFKGGEWLKYEMSYSGFLTAGSATLQVDEKKLNGKEVFHTTGKGWTSGMIKWFFKVEDVYESYFDKDSIKPYLFKRNINEGGYKKNRNTTFNYDEKTALVQDFIAKKDTVIPFNNVQDMLSAFYYLRNKDLSNLKKNEAVKIDVFMDSQVYPFKLKFLGKETLKTKFGKVKSFKFRPLVQSGRVFKAEESVTIWVTADENKIPIKMKADLAVGSLRAELEAYKGLANSFKIIFD